MALGAIDTVYDLDGVPGFFWDEEKRHRAQMPGVGIALPVRNVNGNISSILIRGDNVAEDSKKRSRYYYFSTGKKAKGGAARASTHCPIIKGLPKEVCTTAVCRITEGVLKADIATALDDIYTLGLPGLKVCDDLKLILEVLEIHEIIIALDAGEYKNSDLIRCLAELMTVAEDIGIDFKMELWDPQYGKGIDDVLAAGHKDKIRCATQEEINEILGNGGKARPTILVSGGGLSDEATEGEKALIAAGLPIYQRGTKLVTPIIQKAEASKGRQTKISVLHEISRIRMRDHLCNVALWERMNEQGDMISINPPHDVANTILGRYGEWSFPSIAGVLMTPTLRPDGSILKDIGYDPTTRLYLLDSPPMPAIPESPTRDDALVALGLLDGLLDGFPFVDDASHSVALSALMTPIARGAFKVVPMHVIRAPSPGSGKSYLLDTASAIATGQPCPVIAAGRTEEETEKRLGAALLTGQSIISIDNHNGDLGGDALCQAIERPFVTVRILGKSEQVTIESRSTIFANGNNIRLTGDITRRAVQCLLDAKTERPELRSFKIKPFEMVLDNRGKYIAAILTIVRAYIVAGKPDVIQPCLASFEEWSDLLRSALVWLGKTDPLASMEVARAEDPTLQAISEVFTTLWDVTGGKPYTAKQIIDFVFEKDVPWNDLSPVKEYIHPALREALMNVAADQKGFLTSKRLGHWLSRHKGRICNNLRLENKVDDHGHPALWWLVKSG